MNHLVYYTRGEVIHFTIVFEKSGNELSGSDSKDKLGYLAEHYDVKTIERID